MNIWLNQIPSKEEEDALNVLENLKKTTEEFKVEVFNLVGKEYTVLGSYINTDTKIKIKHNKCGHEYMVAPHCFKGGSRCTNCKRPNPRENTEGFVNKVFKLVGDEYTVLGEYINTRSKIEMRHNKCNHIYMVRPSDFKRGYRCPKCNESKGEKTISLILNKYSLNYTSQYKFDDCRHKNHLPFDFAILDVNDKPILLIEYDGIQHFKPIKFNAKSNKNSIKKQFKLTQKRDNIKSQYCRDNNIPLLRIPYWEFDNINKIVLKKLYKMNLI